MSMNLSILKHIPDEGWKTVFPYEWLIEHRLPENYDWVNGNLDDYRNPDYRPDLELNLSNANFVYLMRDVLCFEGNAYGGFEVDINVFITVAQKWLRNNLGKPSKEVPEVEEIGPCGATLVQCGIREGYENEKIHRMVIIAQQGKEHGGEVVAVY